MKVLSLSILVITQSILSNAFVTTPNLKLNPSTKKESTIYHASSSSAAAAAITAPDKVLVIGGTGGVGQLTTKKLRNLGYGVKVTTRNVQKGIETIDDQDVEVIALDLVNDANYDISLKKALEDVSAVVIATGTTAFPTEKWWGGNTPKAVDEEAIVKIVKGIEDSKQVKKVVLVTSIGVLRGDVMPFKILNLFGVLDAKRAGELAVINGAKESGYDFVIVRPGRLVGGPYTNSDIVALLQVDGGIYNGVTMESGDELLGECKREDCAEAVIQCLKNAECGNVEFAIVSNEEKALTKEQWVEQFSNLK